MAANSQQPTFLGELMAWRLGLIDNVETSRTPRPARHGGHAWQAIIGTGVEE
jgi:hypothetical protein